MSVSRSTPSQKFMRAAAACECTLFAGVDDYSSKLTFGKYSPWLVGLQSGDQSGEDGSMILILDVVLEAPSDQTLTLNPRLLAYF